MLTRTDPPGTRLLSPEETARRLGLRLGTLANRRSLGLAPTYIKIGKAVRYREQDIDAFIEQHRIDPTGE